MRIAYVGNFGPEYSTENDVRKALESIGHEVVQIQEDRATIVELRQKFPSADLILWTGTWDDALPLVDVVDLLRSCAMQGIPSATLHLDIFHSTGRDGRKWWLSPMFYTTYVFTADGGHDSEWAMMGINHKWLRPGVRHDAVHRGKYRDEYACDVAFVGSNGVGYHEDVWPYRKFLVDHLRDMCARNGWTWKNPGGDHAKVDRGDDMNDFYASAKVTVGDSLCVKKKESKYCSDRVYEATGRGGFLIMPEIDFLKADFDGLLSTYSWGDMGGLEKMIASFIKSDNVREMIVEANQNSTRAKHTYVNRVEEMLQYIEKDMDKKQLSRGPWKKSSQSQQ